MTANLVFVLNLIMATVIRFCSKKKNKKKSESEIWLHTHSKVPRLELLIWYLSVKTEMNKLAFIRLRQKQAYKDQEDLADIFFSL